MKHSTQGVLLHSCLIATFGLGKLAGVWPWSWFWVFGSIWVALAVIVAMFTGAFVLQIVDAWRIRRVIQAEARQPCGPPDLDAPGAPELWRPAGGWPSRASPKGTR